jgi:DNA repair protein RadC
METTSKKRQFEVAEIQLSYRTKVKPSQRPKITSSKDAYDILLENWDEDKLEFIEQFKVLLLNRASKVLGIYVASTGGVSGTVADPKLIFAAAIKANASAIILSHCHPSGQLKPIWILRIESCQVKRSYGARYNGSNDATFCL